MQQYLYKYLVLYRRLSIPELGNFIIEPSSATIDGSGKLVLPPLPVIQFRQETALADKNFYHFLADEMGVDEVEAIKQFRDFSHTLKTAASGDDGTSLQGIGRLKATKTGTLSFSPAVDVQDLLPTIALPDGIAFHQPEKITETKEATRAVASAEENGMNQGDSYWWIYAAILLLAGISAILYYYA